MNAFVRSDTSHFKFLVLLSFLGLWRIFLEVPFVAYDDHDGDVFGAPKDSKPDGYDGDSFRSAKDTIMNISEPSPLSLSIPPSKMEIHYYQMWNHNTSTIDVPEKYKNPFNVSSENKLPLTSLEILQNVLHEEKYKAEFDAVEVYMRSYMRNRKTNNTDTIASPPSCLLPDTKATRNLANKIVAIRNQNGKAHSGDWTMPLPVLNVGFSKAGSTTLNDYFNCIGIKSIHNQGGKHMFQRLASGFEMYNQRQRGSKVQARMELNKNGVPGYYPQISLLDELHEEHPESTFVFSFRPIPDWIRSAGKWKGMKGRFSQFIVPGLVKTRKEDFNIDLAKWWCGHVLHIREYVKEYPSHALIELNLYNANETNTVLYDLFQADSREEEGKECWGKSNANPRIKKQE